MQATGEDKENGGRKCEKRNHVQNQRMAHERDITVYTKKFHGDSLSNRV
jgi:hypothetical protein